MQKNIDSETKTPEILDGSAAFHVERRHADGTEIVAVLFEHSERMAEAMETVLKDCDFIGIEQPGHNNGHQRRDAGIAPKAGERMQAAVNNLIEGEVPKAFLLDIHQDHPNYHLLTQSSEARLEYVTDLVDIAPLQKARDSLLKAAETTAESYILRDDILNQQIKEIPARIGKASAGLALGSMHYRALKGVGETDDEKTKKLGERVKAHLPAFDQLIEAIRDNEVTDELVDRALLAGYFMPHKLDLESSEAKGGKLQNDTLKRILSEVERITNLDQPSQEKREDLKLYLEAVADIIESE